jgi:hypothetical protein
MYLQLANLGRNAQKRQKKQDKNSRHKMNIKKREITRIEKEKQEYKRAEIKKALKRKQKFIDFIIYQTLENKDDDEYYDDVYKYQMPSAWELAIYLGSYFHWVITEYDNFVMPNPYILNVDKSCWDKKYNYVPLDLPNMDHILNLALKYGCNCRIIERILKCGASPNRTPYDYMKANKLLFDIHKKQEDRRKAEENALKECKQYAKDICYEVCGSKCIGKCTEIAHENYGYDDYDDEFYYRTNTVIHPEEYREHHLMPPICIVASRGDIESIKILLEYKANIAENVLDIKYENGLTKIVSTEFNVLNYVNRSLNKQCIEFIKSEFRKIQSDLQSIKQCTMAAILDTHSPNCLYIPNIYKHIKSFLIGNNGPVRHGDASHPLSKYIPIDTRNVNRYDIYTKSNLNIIRYTDIHGYVNWIFSYMPKLDLIQTQVHSDAKFIGYNDNCYIPRYQPYILPHLDIKKIGSIQEDRTLCTDFDICINDIPFINKYGFGHSCQEYMDPYHKYITLSKTRESITILCIFEGNSESERINNMIEYYISKYNYVINIDVFGTYEIL